VPEVGGAVASSLPPQAVVNTAANSMAIDKVRFMGNLPNI
jgi:hypothetical protein